MLAACEACKPVPGTWKHSNCRRQVSPDPRTPTSCLDRNRVKVQPASSIADPKPNKQNANPDPTTKQPLPHRHPRLAHPSFPRSRESIPPEQPPPTLQLSLAPLRHSLSSPQYQTRGRGRRCPSFPLSLKGPKSLPRVPRGGEGDQGGEGSSVGRGVSPPRFGMRGEGSLPVP